LFFQVFEKGGSPFLSLRLFLHSRLFFQSIALGFSHIFGLAFSIGIFWRKRADGAFANDRKKSEINYFGDKVIASDAYLSAKTGMEIGNAICLKSHVIAVVIYLSGCLFEPIFRQN
jgi:hypothetical protein